jgi:stage III sporulation protein AE
MKVLMIIFLLISLATPVYATEITIPPVTGEAEQFMPEEMPSFAEGLLYILKTALRELRPDLAQSCRLCLSVIAVAILMSVMEAFSSKTKDLVNTVGVLSIGFLLFGSTNTLIGTAADTVQEISNYGKLLLPVMTAAVAAQGGTASSTILYTGTAFFDALLSTIITVFTIPMVYLFLAMSIGHCTIGENLLKKLRDFLKSMITWSMKTVLYIFTGYMSISSVITGGADKTALKAAKLTISGAVPVVGGIMSDASESILLGAAVVKHSVGIYGMMAIVAIVVLPFFRVGIIYILLKFTSAICSVFTSGKIAEITQGFSEAMGFLLAMTGTMSLLFLISIVCFMKGVSG